MLYLICPNGVVCKNIKAFLIIGILIKVWQLPLYLSSKNLNLSFTKIMKHQLGFNYEQKEWILWDTYWAVTISSWHLNKELLVTGELCQGDVTWRVSEYWREVVTNDVDSNKSVSNGISWRNGVSITHRYFQLETESLQIKTKETFPCVISPDFKKRNCYEHCGKAAPYWSVWLVDCAEKGLFI